MLLVLRQLRFRLNNSSFNEVDKNRLAHSIKSSNFGIKLILNTHDTLTPLGVGQGCARSNIDLLKSQVIPQITARRLRNTRPSDVALPSRQAWMGCDEV